MYIGNGDADMSHQRKVRDNHKLKKLYDETKNSYAAGAYFDERKNRIVKYTCHNEWFKTHSRRIVRRRLNNSDILSNGNEYKKMYDYWWTVT